MAVGQVKVMRSYDALFEAPGAPGQRPTGVQSRVSLPHIFRAVGFDFHSPDGATVREKVGDLGGRLFAVPHLGKERARRTEASPCQLLVPPESLLTLSMLDLVIGSAAVIRWGQDQERGASGGSDWT